MMIRFMLTATALVVSGAALAKIPPPTLDEAAKAKAAETAARSAWQAKVDTYKLCQVQDRIAASYKSHHPAKAAPAAAAPAAATSPTNASASQGGSTPAPTVTTTAAAPVTIPPCGDPGPFAYTPPAEKPLETAGAHSPASNASSPPSVRPESAKLAPSKPSVASPPGKP